MEYYDEILEEIRTCLAEGNLEDAEYLLRKELSMPYIPADTESELKKLAGVLRYRKGDRSRKTEKTMDELLQGLRGKEKTQLISAYELMNRNLRSCTEELKSYLEKDPCPEAACLLVDALAEQAVEEEFVWNKNGVEYTFWADEVIPIEKTDGFSEGISYLEKTLEKDPVRLEMAKSVFIHHAYLILPLNFEIGEGSAVAEQSIREVDELMNSDFR